MKKFAVASLLSAVVVAPLMAEEAAAAAAPAAAAPAAAAPAAAAPAATAKPAKKKAAKKAGAKSSAKVSGASPFSDIEPSHWAYKQIKSLYDAGIIRGDGTGKFKGNERISRYEACALLYQAIQHIHKTKGMGGSVDPDIMDTINSLITELTDEMQVAEVRIEENSDAIAQLRNYVHGNRGVGQGTAIGGRLKIMGQAMFSLVSGSDNSLYSNARGLNNTAAVAAGTAGVAGGATPTTLREGKTEFVNDYMMLAFAADIDDKTSFYTRANVYTGGDANLAAAGAVTGTIRFDDYMYVHVKDLWSDWDMTLGRMYLPWGHELGGAFGTNPYFVSNSMVDFMYGKMVEGAYFSTDSKDWNWGVGIHNGFFASPLTNYAHTYPYQAVTANLGGNGTGFVGLNTTATPAGSTWNAFGLANNNNDDSMGFILHAGSKSKSGDFKWDINYFTDGGDNQVGTGLAGTTALAGQAEMNFLNLGFDYRVNSDWAVAGEWVDGSIENYIANSAGALDAVGRRAFATAAAATAAGSGFVDVAGATGRLVEDDFNTWYLQAVYNLNSKSTLAARYSVHETERAGTRTAVAGFGGNTNNFNDELDSWTFAWTRKISDNGTVIVEYTATDYDLLNGMDKNHKFGTGSKQDDFDVVRASYRIDF